MYYGELVEPSTELESVSGDGEPSSQLQLPRLRGPDNGNHLTPSSPTVPI